MRGVGGFGRWVRLQEEKLERFVSAGSWSTASWFPCVLTPRCVSGADCSSISQGPPQGFFLDIPPMPTCLAASFQLAFCRPSTGFYLSWISRFSCLNMILNAAAILRLGNLLMAWSEMMLVCLIAWDFYAVGVGTAESLIAYFRVLMDF